MNTTCYLVNKNPLVAIGFKTPKEIWLRRPTKV